MKSFLLFCVLMLCGFSKLQAIQVIPLETKKGIKVWFVEEKNSNIIALDAAFKNSGGVHDVDSKLGLSGFASSLMAQGTKTLEYKAFIRKLEELSIASLGLSSSGDHINVSLVTLSNAKEAAFGLLKDVLLQPRFDAVQIQTLKDQIISAIQEGERDPKTVATIKGQEIIFKGHPYGRRNQGTIETIKSITEKDLQDFISTRFSRDRLIVGVCGNMTKDEVIKLVDDVFGDLPAQSKLPQIEKANVILNDQITHIDWDIPQTVIRFAGPGVGIKDPDIYAASILFHLLGSGFEGRLMQEIRVKQGLTYGVGVGLMPMEQADIFAGGMATSSQNAMKAIDAVKKIWEDLMQNGATQEEVDKAKDSLINSYVLGFTQTSQIASQLVGAQLAERDIDYFNKRNDLMRAVTLEDVNRVAKKLLSVDKLPFIKVGKK
jgi:zinc protease